MLFSEFIRDTERGGKLGQAYELGQGDKLERVYVLEHDILACVLVLGDTEQVCVLELELRNLRRKHQQCNQHKHQQCRLQFGYGNREEQHDIDHWWHNHLVFHLLQN